MAARQLHRLTALKIGKLDAPGQYPDGGNLYFQISPSGSRSWIFKFTLQGRSREMGLGPLSNVSLAAARVEAQKCRALLKAGADPIEARNAERRQRAMESPATRLFRDAAADHIKKHRGEWKNAKHASQWENTLETYAYPVIGDVDVRDVDTPMVVRILQPIWTEKRETAARVRGRIESILDSEKAQGRRSGENPARWRGHLELILPKRKRARRVRHHPALPYAQIPEFMRQLAQRPAMAARALHTLILTASRTSEVLFARPEEFDLKRRVWTIPAERMKMEIEHRVPLTDDVIAVVKPLLERAPPGSYVFAGKSPYKAMSNMAMLNLLERMGFSDITVHGFRSTFRDWTAECTEHPSDVAEMALAHAVENEVEAAYRRGDMLERRRRLMNDWARFCTDGSAAILSLPDQNAA
ncbi:tyrosine-type recombinase/integrase [Paraburkholderia caballeronis]|uniref:Integrase n=1 Tax=Paraburkholderia caballeronis TaxID=416943 RepID=A0A1H7TZH6_9BURK|nr:site-specific integrase [Paraburkholderia caballeronis]PXW23429.1 integrase [Paraburkholderia caballeronis]PXW98422.1 integrase [Paraburkholderia caballeronis]RAJ95153.1 integrase [Paraburkholderia caballeronis]SEC53885.1 Integrase [Paraburkholderia caballeronis]SEL90240.1 Integrase [Paraburkholderia caballeronis]